MNASAQRHARRRRDQLVAQYHGAWRKDWAIGRCLYSDEELSKVLKRIKFSSCTASLPYACLAPKVHGQSALTLAVQNLGLFFMKIASQLLIQPMYHTLKPGCDPLLFPSYRTLSQCPVELALCECLWSARCEASVWEYAGAEQMGRANPALTVMIDIEVALIRSDLDLPSGDLFVD